MAKTDLKVARDILRPVLPNYNPQNSQSDVGDPKIVAKMARVDMVNAAVPESVGSRQSLRVWEDMEVVGARRTVVQSNSGR